MPDLTIDGREVRVPDGATVLDAARALGIEVPTMCHLPGLAPSSSCLLCVVRVNGSDRLVPSCATRAEDGMRVESESPGVFEARKMALELLLGDHLGECLAPCHRICPLDLDIPRMTRQAGSGDLAAAIADLRRAVPFPGVLGRVCAAKCEIGCRRGAADEAVSIRNIERHVADADRESDDPWLPPCRHDSGWRVAVVGGGPAGLSAAYFLRLEGHAVTIYERAEKVGGRLRHAYGPGVLPEEVLEAELAIVTRLGAEVRLSAEVGLAALGGKYDAVLLAASGVAGGPGGPAVFAAGDAVRRMDDPARAMASGRGAAAAIDAHLRGHGAVVPTRAFSTVVGKLTEPEMALYLRSAEEHEAIARRGTPTGDHSREAIVRESARCLRCDCRATETCLLKRYAERFGADPTRFRARRRLFTQNLDHPFVIYEPGKCIACGICVTISRDRGEDLGLTFIGRGFDVRVGVPFDGPLEASLRQSARDCVTHCPTGALAFRDGSRGSAHASG